MYTVTVGNIGEVCETPDFDEALETYEEYREQSLSNYGRAAGETVVLWKENEPHMVSNTLSQKQGFYMIKGLFGNSKWKLCEVSYNNYVRKWILMICGEHGFWSFPSVNVHIIAAERIVYLGSETGGPESLYEPCGEGCIRDTN
jgi:hypothetical protein